MHSEGSRIESLSNPPLLFAHSFLARWTLAAPSLVAFWAAGRFFSEAPLDVTRDIVQANARKIESKCNAHHSSYCLIFVWIGIAKMDGEVSWREKRFLHSMDMTQEEWKQLSLEDLQKQMLEMYVTFDPKRDEKSHEEAALAQKREG